MLGDYRVLVVRIARVGNHDALQTRIDVGHLVNVNDQPGKIAVEDFFLQAGAGAGLAELVELVAQIGIRPRPQREREVARNRVHAQRHYQHRYRQPIKADAAGARRGHLLVARHPPESHQHAEQHRHRKRELEKGRHDVPDDSANLAEADAMIDHHVHQLEQLAGDQREGQQPDVHRKRREHLARDVAVDNRKPGNRQFHWFDKRQVSRSSLDIPRSD